jgi:hypothetical protein
MATLVYQSFLKSGSVMDSPCNATSNDSIGIEVMISADNLIGGYERLKEVFLNIYQNDVSIHKWTKKFGDKGNYMKAGTYYTFTSATGFKLPAGSYTVYYAIYSDGLDVGTLPLAPEYNSIPQVS